ncbi:hypothetical protein, partial [Salmonella sp. s32443]|uniref:hypothetical protein n=1 Tax=Salmonella sp. s32443 TaxID=3159639 RepID=UPI0039800AFD
VAVLQSRSPSNQGKKTEYQAEARAHFGEARKVFQAAHDQYEKLWKSYGVFINEAQEPEKFRDRQKAEFKYIQAQLNLALVTYEEAQSYDRKSA